MTKDLIGAIKRKDLKEIVALVLETEGKDEEAKEFRDASRITVALIDRTCVEPTEDIVEEQEECDECDECADGFDPIRDAIAKGKRKKALKLIKEAKANGAKGSVLTNLKTQAKGL